MPPLLPLAFLVVFTILDALTLKPLPHALLQCAEIRRMVDEVKVESQDENGNPIWVDQNKPEDSTGAILKTDSAGRMILVIPQGELNCRGSAKGHENSPTTIYNVYGDERFVIKLEQAAP